MGRLNLRAAGPRQQQVTHLCLDAIPATRPLLGPKRNQRVCIRSARCRRRRRLKPGRCRSAGEPRWRNDG